MPFIVRTFWAGVVFAASLIACAEVNFVEFSVTQISTLENLETGAGATTTARFDGVAAYPEPDGPLYVVHADAQQKESFLKVIPLTGEVAKLTDTVQVAVNLGPPYRETMNLMSGFAHSPSNNKVYFAEDFNGNSGEVSIIGINANSGVATLALRSTDMQGLSDFTVLPNGHIAGVRGADGNHTLGVINTGMNSWTELLTEADFLAAAPGTTELIPDVIGASVGTGAAYVYCQGGAQLFEIPDAMAETPQLNHVTDSALADIVIQDIALDQAGNMFAYNEAQNEIIIIRSSDKEVFKVSMSAIGARLGIVTPLSPLEHRGLSARTAGRGLVDLYLVSSATEHGLVRVRFGGSTSAVDAWHLY